MAASSKEHPRARGENVVHGFPYRDLLGTSPRTRGKHICSQRYFAHLRNIPAHAGKTIVGAEQNLRIWEHPRARGENVWQLNYKIVHRGTSPRTRGKRARHGKPPRWGGNIPAHAGKTSARSTSSTMCWEHPRARGENAPPVAASTPYPGTSPRTRGKQ